MDRPDSALLVFAGGAGAEPLSDVDRLYLAAMHADVMHIEEMAETGRGDVARVAHLCALALRGHDDEALQTAADLDVLSTDPELRGLVLIEEMAVYNRRGNYPLLRDITDRLVSGDFPHVQLPGSLHAQAEAIATIPAMTLSGATTGTLAMVRDDGGRPYADMKINGVASSVLIDTGTTQAVATETAARRLHLKFIDMPQAVVNPTEAAVPARIAVADTLRFGDTELRNVIFSVLPDDASVRIRNRSEAVTIGMGVLLRLKRLEFVTDGNGDRLVYGHYEGERSTDSANMVFSMYDDPLVLAEAGQQHWPLRLLLDTGANQSTLTQLVAEDYPDISAGAHRISMNSEEVGRTFTDDAALEIPVLDVYIGDRTLHFERLVIAHDPSAMYHGSLGQVAFHSVTHVTFDFDRMSFDLY